MEVVKVGYVVNWVLFLEGLLIIGFDKLLLVDGVFYVYVDISWYSCDSFVFVKVMLNEVGVVVMFGVDFDFYYGSDFVWFLFVGMNVDMKEVLVCLGVWF